MKTKSTYTVVLHNANKTNYEVVFIRSLDDVLKILKKNQRIIIKIPYVHDKAMLMQNGITPDTIDFMITIYDAYIE